MASNIPFAAIGKTVTLQTNGVANTNQSAVIQLVQDLAAGGAQPTQVRLVNNSAADIWVLISSATAVAAFPTAGTANAGTPQLGYRTKPGIIEIFSFNIQILAVAGPALGFWVNSVCSVASQTFDLTLGEGL